MFACEQTVLRIGDGRRWHSVNATWQDGEAKELLVPEEQRRQDGYSIQGHHYAFALDQGYQDVRVRFQFRLTPHSDLGIILRARHERCFYVFHMPDCGQASRAQHFWAALSKMDDSGFLRRIKLDLVRRVPSVPREWLDAEVLLQGRRLVARIAGHGQFEAEDDTYLGSGRSPGTLPPTCCAPHPARCWWPTACPRSASTPAGTRATPGIRACSSTAVCGAWAPC